MTQFTRNFFALGLLAGLAGHAAEPVAAKGEDDFTQMSLEELGSIKVKDIQDWIDARLPGQ